MITVIIPAYNAEKYISEAVRSATGDPSVTEIIVIDDYSIDNTFRIASDLSKQIKILKVVQHEGGRNEGPAYSRNYGISIASGEYVAFLDADDIFLPNRFSKTLDLLRNPKTDGIYEAIGMKYSNKLTAYQFSHMMKGSELTTLSKIISSDDLFSSLVSGKYGSFSLVGLTIKKQSLDNMELFDTNLRIGEDTDFIWRLSLGANLLPGNIMTPVAVRRIHGENSILKSDLVHRERIKFAEKWLEIMLTKNLNKGTNFKILRRYIFSQLSPNLSNYFGVQVHKLFLTVKYLLKYKKHLLKILLR